MKGASYVMMKRRTTNDPYSYGGQRGNDEPHPYAVMQQSTFAQETFPNDYATPYDSLTKPRKPSKWPQVNPSGPEYYSDQQTWQNTPESHAYTNYPPYQGPIHPTPEGFQPHPFYGTPSLQQMPNNPTSHPYGESLDGYGPEPYATQFQAQPTGGHLQGIMAQFQDENGQVDVNKMMTTVSQFAQTIQQVTPVVKQVSDLIKAFGTTES